MKSISYIVGSAISIFLLSGCIPLPNAESEAKSFVAQEEQKAETKKNSKTPDIRKLKPYKDYNYKITLVDPFTLKNFVEEIQETAACPEGGCDGDAPPSDHVKGILENYEISALRFVGTLRDNKSVALIQTPDLGILEAQPGDYIGKDNGKIIKIEEASIVIQEKKKQGTQWRDQKKILVINK